MKKEFLFVTGTNIPSSSAESIHVMMQSQALATITDYTLLRPLKWWRPKAALSPIYSSYGLKNKEFRVDSSWQTKPGSADYVSRYLAAGKRNFQCVYCREPSGALAAAQLGHKVALEQHELPSEHTIAIVNRLFELPNFVGIVTITSSLRQSFIERLKQGQSIAERIITLSSAVNLQTFQFSASLSSPLRLGYIGGLFPGKGYEVIRPLSDIVANSVCIYGKIPKTLDVSEAKRIHFKGYIPSANVPKAMETFDVGLLPNQPSVRAGAHTDIGTVTSPMKMFEYMAAGKVVLASDLPVIREVIQDGVNGFLVPHDDPKAWAEKITWMENNRDKVESVRKFARAQTEERYSYLSRAQKILAFFGHVA